MSADHHAIAAAARGCVVLRGLARHEFRDGRGEAFEIARLGKAHVGLHRERQQPRALLLGLRPHPRHVAHHIGGRVDQVLGRELVLRGAGRRWHGGRHHRGIDDEGLSPGDQDALDATAALTLFDEVDELRLLQRAQVVVHALTSHRQLGRELRGRCRLTQPLEQPSSDRREADAEAIGLVEQRDGWSGSRGGHGLTLK